MEEFELVSEIREVEVIARGGRVRSRRRLNKIYGRGIWRKMKGIAVAEFPSGRRMVVEVHWYEAHGIGRREFKVKLRGEEV